MSKSSSNTPAPLTVELFPSRRLPLWLAGLGAIAAVAVWRSGAPAPLLLLLVGSAWCWLWLSSKRDRSGRWRRLRWDGSRWLRIGADRRSYALMLRSAVIWPQLLVLEFEGAAGRETLLLLPDSASPDQQRRLRVCLRQPPVYGRGVAVEAG